MDSEKFEKIDSRIVELYRKPADELENIVLEHFTNFEHGSAGIGDLINIIIIAEFGHKSMAKFYAS